MTDHVFLAGFGFNGYRSFGPELQLFAPLSKINILIGPNNAGKSNVVRFLQSHLGAFVEATRTAPATSLLAGSDLHTGFDPSRQRFALCRSREQLVHEPRWRNLGLGGSDLDPPEFEEFLAATLASDARLARLEYEPDQHGRLVFSSSMRRSFEDAMSLDAWRRLYQRINRHDNEHHSLAPKKAIDYLFDQSSEVPSVNVVPVFRQIASRDGTKKYQYNGSGLVEKLVQLRDPDEGEDENRDRFDEINRFLADITGDPSAELRIPHSKDKIRVQMNGRILPLDSLGTGVHEVVILAVAATVSRHEIVCIEEPEIHLHPIYQRKLLRYLRDKTSNQYVITTHSAHLMDAVEDASVFHVRLENGASKVTPVITGGERSAVCADLGYRASDLVQANSVIWVEGPSDGIYLRLWLKAVAPELREGLHFSIMFYGGRLASHLTADDPDDEAVQEFTSLRRLNRYIAIVIDSDKRSPRAQLGKTKKRLVDEFEKGPGFAWVTKGREIENYLRPELVSRLVAVLHPGARRTEESGDFNKPLAFVGKADKSVEVDKVRLAREVAKETADLTMLDLEQRIKQVARFIREANDLPAS